MKANILINNEVKQIQYFDENHYKLPNGNIVPSVTKKIGDVYRRGFSFEQWLRDTGNESKLISRNAAAIGNKKHNAIERLLKGEVIMPMNELGEEIKFEKNDWIDLCDWLFWYNDLAKENKIKPFAIEQVVYNEKIAGKIDFVGYIDDIFSIMDWKSGKSLHLENFIQQMGYMKLWNDSIEITKLPKIEKAYICHIGTHHKGKSKGTFHNKGIGVFEVEQEKHLKLFNIAMEAWDLMFPDYKIPILDFPLELKLENGILKKENEVQSES